MDDPTLIGNVLLGLFLAITTLAGKFGTQARATRKENRRLRAREELWEIHTYELRTAMARHGIPRPPAPKGLFDDPYPEDESEALT